MENGSKLSVVEALILASPEPLPARKLAEMVRGLTPSGAGKAVAELNNRYMETGCSFRIRELAGGFQFYIVPEFAGYVQELFARRRKMRLTRASLETMAIVAYRQPVTKAEIEHVRGVATDGVVHHLLEKKLITIRGRAKTVGKPLQYGTTDEFLKFFGLADLSDLPKMSEIEELISEQEPKFQTLLELSHPSGEGPVVTILNIADGTYNPTLDNDKNEEPETEQTADAESEAVVRETEPDVKVTDVESEVEVLGSGLVIIDENGPDMSPDSDIYEPENVESFSATTEPVEMEPIIVADVAESLVSPNRGEIEDTEIESSAPVIVDMDSSS